MINSTAMTHSDSDAQENRADRSCAFGDKRIFLRRPGDRGLATVWEESDGGHEQAQFGPIFVVLGSQCSDESCCKISERFSLDVEVLKAFRDAGNGRTIIGQKGAYSHPVFGLIVFRRPGDPDLARADYDNSTIAYEQSDGDGDFDPMMIVIGRHASTERCESMAKHFGIPGEDILLFRDVATENVGVVRQ